MVFNQEANTFNDFFFGEAEVQSLEEAAVVVGLLESCVQRLEEAITLHDLLAQQLYLLIITKSILYFQDEETWNKELDQYRAIQVGKSWFGMKNGQCFHTTEDQSLTYSDERLIYYEFLEHCFTITDTDKATSHRLSELISTLLPLEETRALPTST